MKRIVAALAVLACAAALSGCSARRDRHVPVSQPVPVSTSAARSAAGQPVSGVTTAGTAASPATDAAIGDLDGQIGAVDKKLADIDGALDSADASPSDGG